MKRTLLFIFLSISFSACKGKPNPINPDPSVNDPNKKVVVNLSRGDKIRLMMQDTLMLYPQVPADWPVISIDTAIAFQQIDGYGAALTGSAAYLIHNKMTAEQRRELLLQLFDPVKGIGISFLRLTMGASDFSLSDFTYDDIPINETDFGLEHFSLSQDLDDLIPVLNEILAINPNLHLMGTPWSPPAWMKTNKSLKGGKLRPDCYAVYADYFVRYIQEMKTQGIEITHVTPQNEPLYFTANYPCMEMQAEEQAEFIKHHLGPKFAAAGITTKIIIYDHNWDNTAYSLQILNDSLAHRYTAGSGFHAYAGNVSAMTTVHQAFPDKELHFTEISGGAWATNFGDNLMWNMQNIFIGTATNWSRSALLWNLALDQNYGPTNNGCSNCRGVVTISQPDGLLTFNEEYFSIGHFARFVRPGAKRISHLRQQSLLKVDAVAFLNADGSKVLVVTNYGDDYQTFSVKQGQKAFSYSIPAKSVASFIWD